MNWTLIGWAIIGSAAILLTLFRIFRFGENYQIRNNSAIEQLQKSQVAAMESGEERKVLLGDRLAPLAYPGLGLDALTVLPSFLNKESAIDGGLTIGSADGSLLVFARQIIQNRYQDGFSAVLHKAGAQTKMFGPTPLSFTSAILPELAASSGGSLALFGVYGPESMLWVEGLQRKGGSVFAAGGDLAAQAVLFLTVRDLLIGESLFAYPHMRSDDPGRLMTLFTEDILRLVLMLGLLIGVLLKLGGVL